MAAGKAFEDMVLRKRMKARRCVRRQRQNAIDPTTCPGSIWIVLDVNARKTAELALEEARAGLEN
jgi:hypothetical protein